MAIDESYIESQSYLNLKEETSGSVDPSIAGTNVSFDVSL